MDWKDINSFAPWFSAAGTCFAAWTALRLARRTDTPVVCIEAEFGPKYPIVDGEATDVVVRVTNIGKRPIRVTGIFWEGMTFTWEDHPILPDRSDTSRFRKSTPIPCTLQECEPAEIWLDSKRIGNDFVDHRVQLWEAFVSARWLRIKVELANGVSIVMRPAKSLRRLILVNHFGARIKWRWLLRFV